MSSLVREIQNDALNSAISVADLMRKSVVSSQKTETRRV